MRLEYVKKKEKREAYLKGGRVEAYKQFIRYAKKLGCENFLDIGSADAKYAEVLFNETSCAYLVSTELDWKNATEIVETCFKKRLNVDVVMTTAYELPFRSRSFDAVSSFNVINWKPMKPNEHYEQVKAIALKLFVISSYTDINLNKLPEFAEYIMPVPERVARKIVKDGKVTYTYKDDIGLLTAYVARCG